MIDAASQRPSALPPPVGSVLWQAADELLREVFQTSFDFWANFGAWQLVLERTRSLTTPPAKRLIVNSEHLCERVASTGCAESAEAVNGRMLVGVPLVEHGHLHLVAIGEIATVSPGELRQLAAEFEQRWAERESSQRKSDIEWQRKFIASRSK